MGIFRYESAGLTVSGPCSCGGSLCSRGAALTPRHFHGEGVGKGEAWHGMGHRAYSGSARAVREAYMNPLISPSLPSFLQSSCAASSQRRTSRLPTISTRSRWPLLPSNLIPTCQLLRAPRAQQPAADLPRNRSASSTRSSTSCRVVHHSAPRGQQQRQQLMTGATGPEFEVCDGDVLACSDSD
jgi:hypothetical protein